MNPSDKSPKKAFKGVFIPKTLWLHKDISWQNKCLIAEIDALDDDTGCWASNEYLATVFDSTPESIKVILSRLFKDGHLIRLNKEGKTRLMAVNPRLMAVNRKVNGCLPEEGVPYVLEVQGGTNREGADAQPSRSKKEIAQEVIDHLNIETSRTGSERFHITDERIRTISARLADINGDMAGMKLALSRKILEWKDDIEMVQYIHPDTLFRPSKFLKYYETRLLPVPKRKEQELTPWERKQEIERLEEAIGCHRANFQSIYSVHTPSEEEKSALRQLRERKRALEEAA